MPTNHHDERKILNWIHWRKWYTIQEITQYQFISLQKGRCPSMCITGEFTTLWMRHILSMTYCGGRDGKEIQVWAEADDSSIHLHPFLRLRWERREKCGERSKRNKQSGSPDWKEAQRAEHKVCAWESQVLSPVYHDPQNLVGVTPTPWLGVALWATASVT